MGKTPKFVGREGRGSRGEMPDWRKRGRQRKHISEKKKGGAVLNLITDKKLDMKKE